MGSKIISIGTAVPKYKIPQMEVASFMVNLLNLDEPFRSKLFKIYESSGIGYRHSVLQDYTKSYEDFTFYPDNKEAEPFPSTDQRMKAYKKEALPLAMQAINDCFTNLDQVNKQQITHIITVSCTGLYAPGLDIELIEALHLPYHVQRSGINFMGCYAAFNALKAADHICKSDPEAKVLIVCVELCTLHFQKGKDIESILVNALFSDGAAAVLMSSGLETGNQMDIENFYCSIAPYGKPDMTWDIGNSGFNMRLSPLVPDIIKDGIGELCNNLLKQVNFDIHDIDFFAIHPGGRKILEVIEEKLEISKDDNYPAYKILYHFGNMSSPTVLFVLKEIWEKLEKEDNDKSILSFAFGPGLTLESMLLKVKKTI